MNKLYGLLAISMFIHLAFILFGQLFDSYCILLYFFL